MNKQLPQLEDSIQRSDFKKLNPDMGEEVTLQFLSPKKTLKVKLIGYSSNQSIIVSADKSTGPGLGLEGSRVVGSLMAGNRQCRFQSKLIKVLSSPFPHWHLTYPEQVETRILRQHERIPVDLTVSVDHQDEDKGLQLGLPRIVMARDISQGGIRLESPTRLGQVGDQLFLTLRFKVNKLDQVMLLPAELISLDERKGEVLHGFQFAELEEELQLLLSAFFYQQYLIELGYLGDQ